ncbi:hypothetical protein LEP1GSC043_0329 [Leptospira weilii str. Ecochallenge]|uniref:Uncharacterized protein n=1 Tax=Leptospira weilii str. Ecochallenge TaxID=1049986 RepID=N1UF97_9LEPT|nr:hypothetical protein LEP1GSC043_0329 [Leptospira weilii str. Ecochallenge]
MMFARPLVHVPKIQKSYSKPASEFYDKSLFRSFVKKLGVSTDYVP